MFKRLNLGRENKTPKTKQLWGRDFNIVESGLDEKQVASLINDLLQQPEASSPTSVRAVMQTAVTDAKQIVDSIKIKAQAEAEEEAARIIAQAKQEAEEIKGKSEKTPEKEVEDILVAASRGAGDIEVEAKQEESAPLQEEGTVAEPAEMTVAEPLAPHPPEKKTAREEVGAGLLKKDSHSLYTGEVELTVAKPVDPKMVSKLYNYLQTTSEIKFVRTSGSWERGTTVTVVLDKPIALMSVLSAKIPEAEITPERPEKDGFVRGKKGVRGIRLALKEG